MTYFLIILLNSFVYLNIHKFIPVPKVMMVLSVIIIINLILKRQLRFIKGKLITLTTIFIVSLSVSIPFSTYKKFSIEIMIDFLKYILIVYLTMQVLYHINALSKFVWLWLSSMTILALSALWADGGITGRVGAAGVSAYSFMGDPNDFAVGLSLALPFSIYGIKFVNDFKYKILLSFSVFSFLAGLILSVSRGGMLTFGAVLFFMLYKSKKKLRNVIIIVLIIALVTPFLPSKFTKRLMSINTNVLTDTDDTAQHRIVIWKAGLQMMLSHPFVGVGLGRFPAEFGYKYDPKERWRVAHNTYVNIGAECGIISLFLYLFILYSVYSENKKLTEIIEKNNEEGSVYYYISKSLMASIIAYSVGTISITAWYYPHLYLIIAFTHSLTTSFYTAQIQKN